MDAQRENLSELQAGAGRAGLAPVDELATDEVPDSLVADFYSLTTPYCWVITEDAVAGYDGAEPSASASQGRTARWPATSPRHCTPGGSSG